MKTNKYLNIGLSLVALVFTATSCTDDFEEINTNPNGPISVPSDLLLTSIQESTADILYNAQIGGDMGACIIQHWGKVQYNDEERYAFRSGVINNIWNGFYAGGINDAKAMIRLAEEEENEVNQGVGKIMQAYIYSLLVEMYGPIPFSEALLADEGNTTPAYDDEATVYSGIIDLYDEGIALLDGSGSINETQDLMYDGDVDQWKKAANSLKFRTLMRISDASVAGVDVAAGLQSIVNSGVHFTSNADNAILPYTGVNPNANPIWNTIVFTTRSEYKINQTTVQLLEGLNDPRLAVYAQPNDGGIIRGVAPGILNPVQNGFSYANVSALGTQFLAADFPATFMSYSELNFLLAEAAKRGLINGGDAAAEQFYNAGITASFDTYGVAGASNYISNEVAYEAANALEQIGTQNYIALYSQGVEAWTEWRRTKFPALSPAIDPIVGTQIPSRYTYPTDEQSLNSTNYSAGSSMLGGDDLSTKLIFVK
ncbi:SusD/RagB family nutrient-binding outer membrane lipoprotein [Marivirga sp. S37H4]|uniref:SusD/RagB family nutrient-binding outer membrane lipoprotein n=1 Tax=Marivirga aurantiaca TaxID=2802615 RepID=A0A934WUZ4_9BACT|nr:SusD/RagB family nutrient-binding outer membrane lipoprotein [Marivirga aurantiaca]MBK6263462.1 SusD/RagB family nutrient-binding outer membrane lipoprotein [Marivirga aurantiaca]